MKEYIKAISFCIIVGIMFFSCGKESTGPGPVQVELKWGYEGPAILSSPAMSSDGAIYAFSDNDTLYSINSDGTLKWKHPLPDTIWYNPSNIFSSPVVALDGTIYIFAVDGYLYAINSNGTLTWKYPVSTSFPAVGGTPAIGSDGTIYAHDGQMLHAINPNGSLKWEIDIGANPVIPVIGPDGTIYIGADRDVFAINPDGSVKWSIDMAPAIYGGDRLALESDGTLYVFGVGGINDAGNILAINPDGTTKWTYQIEEQYFIAMGSPVIGQNGIIYLAGNIGYTGYIYAITNDGQLQWKVENPANWQYQELATFAIDSDGIIYIQEGALNPDGTLKWEYPVGNIAVSSVGSPVIGSDGTIYVGSPTGLYAFEGTSQGLASSAWPRFQHDNKNTGRIGGQ